MASSGRRLEGLQADVAFNVYANAVVAAGWPTDKGLACFVFIKFAENESARNDEISKFFPSAREVTYRLILKPGFVGEWVLADVSFASTSP
jgi:hypothetical protein